MADYNWAADAGSSKSSSTAYSGGFPNYQGVTADIFDNDLASAQSISLQRSTNIWVSLNAESDFAIAHKINKIVAKVNLYSAPWALSATYQVDAYYSGSWHTVGSGSVTTPGVYTYTYDNLNLSGVSKVRLYIYSSSGGYEASVQAGAYELQAWGPKYFDIGLRMRTSSEAIKIGVLDLEATHKLRIRKGSTTYGIPLLATDDSDASGLRIYDGSAVKALPKVA
jgi:hypothetical protein